MASLLQMQLHVLQYFAREINNISVEDGSAATQNIIIAAKSYGIDSCWVAGNGKEYAEDVRELLKCT